MVVILINKLFKRVYVSTGNIHKLETGYSTITIRKDNFPDTGKFKNFPYFRN